MSEKLTVAELLARSGRTSSDSGRRRRRRSLDEGGISVAELTGAIPVVEDAESEASTAPAPGADKREQPTVDRAEAGVKQADKAEKTAKPEQAKQAQAAEQAEDKKAEAEKAKQAEAKQAKEAAAKKAAEEKAEEEAAAKKAAAQKAEQKKPEQKKPEPKNAAAVGSAIVDRREVPAQRPEEKTSEIPAVTDKSAPAKKNTEPSTEQTALITKVTADQAEGTEAAQKPAARNASATKAPAKGADRKDADQKGSGAGAAAAAATTGAAGTAAATRGSDAERKGEEPAPEEFHSPEELEELQRTLGEDEVIEYEDDTISWPALIGQAIAAILVGIGVFLGFKLLWGSLPAVLVLVLALAVTLVMVGVVHALLRHRDKLIMILTFVVGLVLTIGPRLIMSI
ncbi:hypothetical protein HMPREF3088_04095 [Corynebacterium sp. HMSC22B11]|uniref:hypothetical protein n=1 Tax=Corynebacterium sp. HMSC22B11 TaxID=1581056 RepID=UPI0008A2B668|nr:hypothetical protein [Corynebacterium sp. HMSC22B11]OFO15321.1 hypothetical protein HMPREF3088_04095 [Corynebacterium sp. HMSC22B11]